MLDSFTYFATVSLAAHWATPSLAHTFSMSALENEYRKWNINDNTTKDIKAHLKVYFYKNSDKYFFSQLPPSKLFETIHVEPSDVKYNHKWN